MFHTMISAAIVLRAPPRHRLSRSLSVKHSRWPGQRARLRACEHSTPPLKAEFVMPPKKAKQICDPSGDTIRWVLDWPYRVYADGLVMVGTGSSGTQFARWTFRLTSYADPDYNNLNWRDDCVRQELIRRMKGRGPGTYAVELDS